MTCQKSKFEGVKIVRWQDEDEREREREGNIPGQDRIRVDQSGVRTGSDTKPILPSFIFFLLFLFKRSHTRRQDKWMSLYSKGCWWLAAVIWYWPSPHTSISAPCLLSAVVIFPSSLFDSVVPSARKPHLYICWIPPNPSIRFNFSPPSSVTPNCFPMPMHIHLDTNTDSSGTSTIHPCPTVACHN